MASAAEIAPPDYPCKPVPGLPHGRMSEEGKQINIGATAGALRASKSTSKLANKNQSFLDSFPIFPF